jgi:hypothetical protein
LAGVTAFVKVTKIVLAELLTRGPVGAGMAAVLINDCASLMDLPVTLLDAVTL